MNDLVTTKPTGRQVQSYQEMHLYAQALYNSGYFENVKSVSQALVKIMYGRDLGLSPSASMNMVHIIDNKPCLSARLMSTLIKKSGKYDYRIRRLDNEGCILQFYEDGKPIDDVNEGRVEFLLEDAELAGLVNGDKVKRNWVTYPKAMYFARALSAGFVLYCPHLGDGGVMYTPDELGADVDAEGNPVASPSRPRKVEVSTTATINNEQYFALQKAILDNGTDVELLKARLALDDLNFLTPETWERAIAAVRAGYFKRTAEVKVSNENADTNGERQDEREAGAA